MGFRFRKSFKIAPGVKLNISKKSIGISAGTKGARVSVNSSGRVTKSVGIPGTGISYSKSEKIGSKKKVKHGSAAPDMDFDPLDERSNTTEPSAALEPIEQVVLPVSAVKQQQPSPAEAKKSCGGVFLVIGIAVLFKSLWIGLPLTALGLFWTLTGRRDMRADGEYIKPLLRCKWVYFAAIFMIAGLLSHGAAPAVESIDSIRVPPATMDIAAAPQAIEMNYQPKDADASTIKVESSDPTVATIALDSAKDGVLKATITPVAEGNTQFFARAADVASHAVTVAVVDSARIAAEQKAAEEKVAAEKAAAEKAAAAAYVTDTQTSGGGGEAVNPGSREQGTPSAGMVYITPSGKRWHLSKACAGSNAIEVSPDDVGGRTPCKKCAS